MWGDERCGLVMVKGDENRRGEEGMVWVGAKRSLF